MKPVYFFVGEGDNRKGFEIVDYRTCEEYRDISESMCAQDYEHASLNKRLELAKNL